MLHFSNMMGSKIILSVVSLIAFATSHANADHLHEVRILTSDCDGCGMAAFFGQISVKVYRKPFLSSLIVTPRLSKLYSNILNLIV